MEALKFVFGSLALKPPRTLHPSTRIITPG